jgi:hypothetical protein
MMRLIERAQRPHCASQPRQRYSSPVVRGGNSATMAVLTAWSLRTLQEQMIIGSARGLLSC